jgi:hypothetical protein
MTIYLIDWLIDWLIDLGFYAVLAIFEPYYGDKLRYSVWFWKFGFPWRPPMSLLFFDYQGNDILRAKGVVILDTGHHLSSNPTNLKVKIQTDKSMHKKNVYVNS